jgi:glycerophosphoryl diester phosphodiesterase
VSRPVATQSLLRSHGPMPPLYAHRLGRAYGPDSSAAALAGALAAGVDGLETDLCLTADGGLVLLHDCWLPACTDMEGWAHDRTSRELRRARLRDRRGAVSGESPLFLDDLLAAAPMEIVLQLEVKAYADPVLAARTVDALAERRNALVERKVEVLSFVSTACSYAAAVGLPARLVIWADYAIDALTRWARRHRVIGVCVEHFMLSHHMAAALRGGGLSLTTGTINEPALAARARRFVPDAITSDAPHALLMPAEGHETFELAAGGVNGSTASRAPAAEDPPPPAMYA